MTDGGAYRIFNRRNEDLVLVEGPQSPHFHVKRDGQWEYRVFFLEEGAVQMFSANGANCFREPTEGC
jgi:hypothetical protein